MTDLDPTFIETQLPVSKLSKESYKERSAKNSQILTGLGKWWGRKPLILVRAAVLGLLLPATDDPRADREVFLKLLTMDDDGLRRRKTKSIALKDLYALLTPAERAQSFKRDTDPARPRLRAGLAPADRERLQHLAFDRLGYDDKLRYCDRPEQVPGPDAEAWRAINAHLDTNAGSLPALVRELGERRFGRVPAVGDAFCGGGSVPFEAARIGCHAAASDLNPVAALLTWAALHIVGGGPEVAARVREAQQQVFDAVDRQITDWRIEHNAVGWRADAYLYCVEVRCPDCGWRVPLAPSCLVGEKPVTVARLVADAAGQRFDIAIEQGVSRAELDAAKATGTVRDSRLHCPHCGQSNAIAAIRDNQGQGLRPWETADLVPRADDVFQERLYCVRWRLPDLADLLWAEQHERHGGPDHEVGAPPRPVPDWVPLDEAIAARADGLDPAGRDELALLRERDWLAEDAELADAEDAWRTAAASKRPKAEIQPLRERHLALRDQVQARQARVAALAQSLATVRYAALTEDDLTREALVLELLQERFEDWQAQGFVFTHQDAGVWADLALILWAAGLRVTAAWTIATETDSALKAGNYVQGTVLMVLRKRTGAETAFLDELVPLVETEVQAQLRAMLGLDDAEDPNFSDADYQLAAYAAALRVLTGYANIEDLDVAYELARERTDRDKSPIVGIIEDAVRTASNSLIPPGLEGEVWRRLSPEERLYLKCPEVESHGDYRSGVFMEFARGLGVRDYRYMLHSGRANQTRLNTASELKRREWGGAGFGASTLRHCLYAVYQTAAEDDPAVGRTYLKTELADYWGQRRQLIALAEYLSRLPMTHWRADAEAAQVLAGLLRQDGV